MSAPAAAAAKKATKLKTVKKVASHPTYSAMIKAAIKADGSRTGTSRQTIANYIAAQYKLAGNQAAINAHLRLALVRGVKKGLFTQPKGTGANGSFRNSESAKAKKAEGAKVAKPKTKKAAPKKAATGEKKPKSPKKKTPKAKTTAKPKSPKKAKSPKKVKATKPKSPKKAKTPKAKKAVKA
ncbi:hypothetical protein PENTCL1PPCAC_3555, partial [Pristionchus entomophagus]